MRDLDTRLVRLGDLRPHPENANLGDVEAVRESLDLYGQWRPVVARPMGDGEPMQVLIGHTMLRAAQALRWDRIAVHERPADDDEARRILAIDNHTRDLAQTDEAALVRLLSSLDTLDGTSYRPDDLDNYRALVEEQETATLRAMREAADTDRPTAQVRTTPSHTDLLGQYEGKGTRHLALIYPVPVFVWLVEQLDKIGAELGIDTNAERVLRLVEQRADSDAPPMTDPEPDDIPADIPGQAAEA